MYFLGESIAHILKFKGKEFCEDFLMKIGIGLASFPLITIILNVFHLILWLPLLLISAIIPVTNLVRYLIKTKKISLNIKNIKFQKKHIYFLIVIVIFFASIVTYAGGSFKYPYLEDGDPLSHAEAAKYISETGTFSTQENARITHYLEPYPPFYSSLMSIHVALSDYDMIWTLKFFNALIISLGIFFIFFAVKKITESSAKGAMAAFLLLAINSYVSHFIFAASYATTMILPAIYFLVYAYEKNNKENQRKSKLLDFKHFDWSSVILAGIVISSVFLIQPITSGIFAVLLGIMFLINIKDLNKAKTIFIIVIIGLLLSQLFWTPAIAKYGVQTSEKVLGFSMFLNAPGGIDNDSSGGVIYSFKDFLNAPLGNKIDQPVGVGAVLFIIFLLSTIVLILKYRSLKKQNKDNTGIILATLIWTVIVMIMLEGNAFPYKFVPHRLWAYFSIGVVIITTIGGGILLNSINSKQIKYAIILAFIIGVVFTSFIPKYTVQNSSWPYGPEWNSPLELQGYLSMMKKLPANTPVYALCSDDMKPASVNMAIKFQDDELTSLKNNYKKIMNENLSISQTLKDRNINFLIIDTTCAIKMGVNETNDVLQKIISEKFGLVFKNDVFFLLQTP